MARVTRLSTGIDPLDRELEGGILAGSVVVLSADPASQSELFLSQLAETRRTFYLTTVHSSSTVKSFLGRAGVDTASHTIKRVDPESPLEHAYDLVKSLPHESNLIVDAMDPLEDADRAEFWSFMNAVRDHLEQTSSLGVLHCMDGRSDPAHRDTTEYMADVVFDLVTEFDGEEITNRLLVPKVRGEAAINSAIKLDLSDEVSVDTSRDIG